MNRTGLIIALAIAVVVGVIFGLFPQLDLMISAPFHPIYDANHNTFALHLYPSVQLARDIGLWVGTVIIIPVVAALLIKLLLPRRRLLPPLPASGWLPITARFRSALRPTRARLTPACSSFRAAPATRSLSPRTR